MTSTATTDALDRDLAALVKGGAERSAALYENPHELFDALRAHSPIYHSKPLGITVITTFELVKQFYRERNFSSVQDIQAPLTKAQSAWVKGGFAFTDPPEHTRMRKLCAAVFTPRAVEAQRANAAATVGELIEKLRERESFDFKQEFAYALPQRVISDMLGIPRVEQDNFARWAGDISRALETSQADPPTSGTAMRSSDEMLAFFDDVLAAKRANPGDDLLSNLVQILDSGEMGITADDVVSTSIMLYTGGFTTTANLINNLLWTLIRNPDVYADLRANPDLVPNAVEEAVRYESPARNAIRRRAMSAFTFGGHDFAEGETVYAIIAAANRDPAVFEDPHRFDIRRVTEERHVGFGGGIHVCIGASLARLEVQEALLQLIRQPELTLDADGVEWEPRFVLRRLKALPVRWKKEA